MATQFTIISAPSKWELMLALFDHKHHSVSFRLYSKNGISSLGHPNFQVEIRGVSLEDGSGESFYFNGYHQVESGHSQSVKGWFRTSDRKGYLQIIE